MKHTIIFCICFLISSSVSLAQVQTSSGVSSDGRDFYVGFVNPSYNTVASPQVEAFFGAFILVSATYETRIEVSYFDKQTGVESVSGTYRIPARTGVQIPLDINRMSLDTTNPLGYAACHVSASLPVNVQFFSTGACAGGSYLALATPVLGKKYVVASYNNNPGKLGIAGTFDGPSAIEVSHGFFLVTAAFDSTVVTIIPNSTTVDGHPGYSSGKGATIPNVAAATYTVTLNRGECYFVRSAGSYQGDDMSGSIVESTKPVAVLGGHENAAIGGVSNRNLEGRDFMVEQMIPADFWDTTGYVMIPLIDSQPQNSDLYEGTGENYRTYAYDSSQIGMYDGCVSGTISMSTSKLAQPPPERFQGICPVDVEATNGKKFGVMMYDNRNFANSAPYPAPSMMTVIPISRWKTSYSWYVPANKFETLQYYFINVIGQTQDFSPSGGILASYNGGNILPISSVLSKYKTYKGSIPNHPEFTGITFKLSPGSYFAKGPHPFIVYNYGFRGFDPDFDLGDLDGDDFFFSYANPTGASFSSGDTANFKVILDSACGKWDLCVFDQRKNEPGIRSIALISDSLSYQFAGGKSYSNCYLDTAIDPSQIGEGIFSGNVNSVCFTVHVTNALLPAYAPVLVTDNAGNEVIVDLHYSPPQFTITPNNFAINLSNVFLNVDSCALLTVKNTDSLNHTIGTPAWDVGKNFTISSVQPSLPVTLKHNDSVQIHICLLSKDTTSFTDILRFNVDCLPVQVSVAGNGATGLIYASDHDFGRVFSDNTICDTVSILNTGKFPFTVTGFLLTGSPSFTYSDTPFVPVTLLPGQKKLVHICYTASKTEDDTATIHWNTNIPAPYTESVKSYSVLTANRSAAISWDRTKEDLSVVCKDSEIVRVLLLNTSSANLRVDSVFVSGPNAAEWYILDDGLGFLPMKNFPLNHDDTVYVDLVFKPDLSKPIPARYADRNASLVAFLNNETDQTIDLTGHVLYGAPVVAPDSLDIEFTGNSGSKTFYLSDTGTAPVVVESLSPVVYPNINLMNINVGDSIQPGQSKGRLITVSVALTQNLDTTIFLTFTFDHPDCAGNITIPVHIKRVSSGVAGDLTNDILTIRPNPANGKYIIISLGNVSETDAEVKIFDVLGRELITRKMTEGEIQIPVWNLQNGTYYAHVKIGDKVIVQAFEVIR